MHETLFASPEGRMLGLGLALTGLMLLAFGIGWHLYPDRILPYAIMTGLNLIIGREAGTSFGYASGFGHAQVVPLNILIETIQVLVIYPLFVQSTRHLIKLRMLQPFITHIHHAAQSGGGVVRKFGIAGLFVFVFATFWMTGPVKLITYHSSKGLEFPLVAIPGVCISTDDDKAAEDEARLLYVAMTRATRELLVLESEAV